MTPEHLEITKHIRDVLSARGLSVRKLAENMGVPARSLQNVLDCKEPKVGRAAEICRALDLEFYIGPKREDWKKTASFSNPGLFAAAKNGDVFTPDRFDAAIDLPGRGYATCSLFGHLNKESQDLDLPAPVNIRALDAQAFYVQARGQSMVPEGIRDGDYCLVAPGLPITPCQRVWLKDLSGRACIKRLLDMNDKTYTLRGWLKPEHRGGPQKEYIDHWVRDGVVESGRVVAVYRGQPNVSDPPILIPDPYKAAPPEIAKALGLEPGASIADTLVAITKIKADGGGSDEKLNALIEEKLDAFLASKTTAKLAVPVAVPPAPVEATISHTPQALPGKLEIIPANQLNGHMPDFVAVPEIGHDNGRLPIALSRKWLELWNLNPKKITVFEMDGMNMEPRMVRGDYALIDTENKRFDGITAFKDMDNSIWLRWTLPVGDDCVQLWAESEKPEMGERVKLADFDKQFEIIGNVFATLSRVIEPD